MDIKAVAFDVGETLVFYNNYLNWQSLYSSAIKEVLLACGCDYGTALDENAQKILLKFNTRINYREYEVSSDVIFTEILSSWGVSLDKMRAAKQAFYGFFQKDAHFGDDTEYVLKELKKRGVITGVLTDVAYGMDNEYALRDIKPLKEYIDICLTSRDVGYRKPHIAGYTRLQQAFGVSAGRICFVGNEEKDIIGANNAGMNSILLDKDRAGSNFGQHDTVAALSEILSMIS